MGREVKRVPVDFAWPIGQTWEGFLRPECLHSTRCDPCGHSGYNPATRELHESFYSEWSRDLTQDEVDALVARDRLNELTHIWVNEERGQPLPALPRAVLQERFDIDDESFDARLTHGGIVAQEQDGETLYRVVRGWIRREDRYHPTAAEVNAAYHPSVNRAGHDSINAWICTRARAERLGVYGMCEHCDGLGSIYPDAAHDVAAEAWESTPVPTGEGWQVWETVSEGSPRSPAFATAEQLVDWLVCHEGYGPESAAAFVKDGWAPSMVIMGNGGRNTLYSNIDAIGALTGAADAVPYEPEVELVTYYDDFDDDIPLRMRTRRNRRHVEPKAPPEPDHTMPARMKFTQYVAAIHAIVKASQENPLERIVVDLAGLTDVTRQYLHSLTRRGNPDVAMAAIEAYEAAYQALLAAGRHTVENEDGEALASFTNERFAMLRRTQSEIR